MTEANFVTWGTPLEDEAQGNRFRKPVQDPSSTRSLPIHLQEVTDDHGRKRFHGAFTGGFSAGYFNTVGSAQGWMPSDFVSSRKSRAQPRQQEIQDFLDEDEREEHMTLQTTDPYDTFGHASTQRFARQAAALESRNRPSAIPELFSLDILAPVATSVVMRLLQRMGWRHGRGIGTTKKKKKKGRADPFVADRKEESQSMKLEEDARKTVGVENIPLFLLRPKKDRFGLGFDPYAGAQSVGKRVREQQKTANQSTYSLGKQPLKRSRIAFGVGALEDDDDTLGMMEDYVLDDEDDGSGGLDYRTGLPRPKARNLLLGGDRKHTRMQGNRLALNENYAFEEVIEEEEEEEKRLQVSLEKPSPLHSHHPLLAIPKESTFGNPYREDLESISLHPYADGYSLFLIPGFHKATQTYRPPFYPAPCIPPEYVPRVCEHKPEDHSTSLGLYVQSEHHPTRQPSALQRYSQREEKPEDAGLCSAIESLAAFVARSGPVVETLAREAQQEGKSPYRFLLGGPGASYYRNTIERLCAPGAVAARSERPAIGQRPAPLTASERGALLGEAPARDTLEVSSLKGAGGPSQKRDKIEASSFLQSTFTRGSEEQEEAPRGLLGSEQKLNQPKDREASSGRVLQSRQKIITAADLSQQKTAYHDGLHPPREISRTIQAWRPTALLCKRLHVPEPPLKEGESVLDSVLDGDTHRGYAYDDPARAADDFLASLAQELDAQEKVYGHHEGESTLLGPSKNEEERRPPRDLFKVIFEDSSDEIGGESSQNEDGLGAGDTEWSPSQNRDEYGIPKGLVRKDRGTTTPLKHSRKKEKHNKESKSHSKKKKKHKHKHKKKKRHRGEKSSSSDE